MWILSKMDPQWTSDTKSLPSLLRTLQKPGVDNLRQYVTFLVGGYTNIDTLS